ncbi:MAG TPA: hypothetical protein VFE33_20770 [Thermoanaerobaculia bacterium]|nr:hypothetical protein [Thermoanaerobaculia bacterium]
MSFSGGSAYAMARDIAGGFTTVTERTFKNMLRSDLDQLTFEMDRHLRELRGEILVQDDVAAIQQRNRRLQRLNSALVVLRNFRQKSKN